MTPPLLPSLRLLGPPGLFDPTDGRRLLGPGKPLVLLARLLGHPEGVSRDSLVALLWPQIADERAKASLRQALHSLRQHLGSEAIDNVGARVVLRQEPDSDRARFVARLADGDDVAALTAYTGPFLADVTVPDAADAEQWISLERRQLSQRFAQAAHRQIRRLLEQGDVAGALPLALQLRDDAPDDETAWKPLLAVLDRSQQTSALQEALGALRARLDADAMDAPDATRALLARYATVLEAAPTPVSEPASPWRGRFVGRDAEVGQLLSLWERVREGQAARALVSGAAGVGKSRLIEEFVRRPRAERATVITVRARRLERDDAYALLGDVVQALTALPGSLGIMQSSATALVSLVPALIKQFPGATWQVEQADHDRQLMLAMADLMTTLADERALVLVLDDVHWADAASVAVLERAAARLGRGRVLMLAAARPRATLAFDGWHRVELRPFTEEQLRTLMRRAGPEAAEDQLVQQIHQASGGVPLFALQALDVLVDQGLVVVTDGRWHVPAMDAALALVRSHDLLAMRLAAQSGTGMRLLTCLALADGPVPLPDLHALGSSPAEVDRALHAMDEAGFAVPLGDATWGIGHDVVTDMMLHLADPAMRRAITLELAQSNARRATSVVELRRAVRLFLEANATEIMLDAVRQWVDRVPEAPRGAALASSLLGPNALPALHAALARAVPAPSPSRWRLLAAVGLTLAACAAAVPWWLVQPARLVLVNAPYYSEFTNQAVPPVFEVHNRRGALSMQLDGQSLSAELLSGADSVTGVTATRVRDGTVTLDSLRVWAPPPGVVSGPLRVRFRLAGLAPTEVELRASSHSDSLWLEAGVLAGQALDRTRPVVTIAPGDSVRGWLRVRYTSPLGQLTIMLAQFRTWGDLRADTIPVASLITPARNAWLQHPVQLVGPSRPGNYWLVWTFGAEADAKWITSGTNWRCGAPVWGDGNDLATLPDGKLAPAWGSGRIPARRYLCDPGVPRAFEGQSLLPAVAIRVQVR
ncbi:MAG: AAA family ATPase [Gemmatimonadaceae bacterium]